ncbi:hypothetical protein yc1106_05294 [Curvularia clavata]|uniref:T6SS Phospholipase effector Tle1-like catalytic domain-containing protein n=1 Tax=Curvularia clavata TaxID=95742 RepID=A0A9Q8ZA86_CURCL|nr:hypothetical protein yc1106_05294 [Curvularia clavata]
MPHSTDETSANLNTPAAPITPGPRKLILCFDGTGNVFEGNTSDTNIVKLYDKFDRKDPMQYHYYQTGIGTYNVDGGPINKNLLGRIRSNISKSIDSGFATTFDAHVIAGYRFIMKYYKEGDKIYMFGFSRGAFTARFLARMIYKVGLLSEGNEEMVPFAYDLYQQYELGKLSEQEKKETLPAKDLTNKAAQNPEHEHLLPNSVDTDPTMKPDAQQLKRNKLIAFKETFCRSEGADNTGIKVYFLGMFDCVSSVAVLDGPSGTPQKPVSVYGTARHVRHAVAVDEHRVKFKAALLGQDIRNSEADKEKIKEVWFPGNHGDVGGGWPAPYVENETQPQRSWWQRIFLSWNDKKPSNRGTDPYQMSDVPLAWMIRELELLGKKDESAAIKWNWKKNGFKKNFFRKIHQAYESPMHDTLKIGGGSSLFKVLLWNLMEWLPFRRWELVWDPLTLRYKWAHIALPLNKGGARDIPEGALLHDSLLKRLESDRHTMTGDRPLEPHDKGSPYLPCNDRGGDDSQSCLTPYNFELKKKDKGRTFEDIIEPPGIHDIYKLKA